MYIILLHFTAVWLFAPPNIDTFSLSFTSWPSCPVTWSIWVCLKIGSTQFQLINLPHSHGHFGGYTLFQTHHFQIIWLVKGASHTISHSCILYIPLYPHYIPLTFSRYPLHIDMFMVNGCFWTNETTLPLKFPFNHPFFRWFSDRRKPQNSAAAGLRMYGVGTNTLEEAPYLQHHIALHRCMSTLCSTDMYIYYLYEYVRMHW